jgi:predicted Zn-dependent peptidase
MKIIKSDILKARVYAGRTSGGLRTYLWPMRGFTRYFAVVGVKYGSVDNTFVPPGKGEAVEMPAGIAHFLEHKLFEDRKGGVDGRFSALGASSNAMTGYDSTMYFFSCTENFERSLRLLLGFVGRPDFGEEGVEREKGIIGQEIMMVRDNPDWRIYHNMIEAMYVRHPARIDTAGTVESVGKISRGQLMECHRTFYSPGNMIFVAAGDFDAERIFSLVESATGKNDNKRGLTPLVIERVFPEEPAGLGKKRVSDRMDVTRAKVMLGFKEREGDYSPGALFRRDIITSIALDVVLGRTGRLYNEMYSRGLIDGTFGWSYSSHDEGFGFSVIGGDTERPGELARAVMGGLRRAGRRGLDGREFLRKRKKAIGSFLGTFDSPDSSAMLMAHFQMRGSNIFDYFKVMEGVTLGEANRRLRSHLSEDNCVVSEILPLAGKK